MTMNVGRRSASLISATVAVLAMLSAGCSSPEPSGPLGGSPSSPTTAIAESGSPGHCLFVSKGCAACHGQNAEGTSIAPALPGHNEQMVKNQVRNPRFQMPAFGVDQISNAELDAIAGFIAGIEGDGHRHAATLEEPVERAAAVEMHHWMALESLESHDTAEAIHHVGHIIELLQPGEHRQRMQEILASLESGGEFHEPEHQIEEMLAGSASPGLTLFQLHLRQALDSLDADDGSEAKHHLAHAQEIGDEAASKGLAEVQELLELEDHHGAEHEIQEILGRDEHHD